MLTVYDRLNQQIYISLLQRKIRQTLHRKSVRILCHRYSTTPERASGMEIKNHYEALVKALVLAITAQTDDQISRIDPMVQEFAAGFDEVTIERAKKEALIQIKEQA